MADPQPSTSAQLPVPQAENTNIWQPWMHTYQCPICRIQFLSSRQLYGHLGENPDPSVGCLRGIGTKATFKHKHKTWLRKQSPSLIKNRQDSLRRYHESRTAARTEDTYSETLAKFGQATRYGPMFPCISCHGAFFKEQVCRVQPWLEQQAAPALDIPFIESRPNMFSALDSRWICTACKDSTSVNELPKLSANNGLPCSWAGVPEQLGGHIDSFSVELSSSTSIYRQIEGCTNGVTGQDGTTRTWMIPLGQPVGGQTHDTARPPQHAYWLHSCPPQTTPRANADRVVSAVNLLQQSHPDYVATPAEQAQRKTAIRTAIATQQNNN